MDHAAAGHCAQVVFKSFGRRCRYPHRMCHSDRELIGCGLIWQVPLHTTEVMIHNGRPIKAMFRLRGGRAPL